MTEKEKRELFKQFNMELVLLCREGGDLERVRYLSTCADIFFGGLKALSSAAKKQNFDAIDILIDAGILSDERAKRIIASVCDYKNFFGEAENRYFDMLDKAIKATGAHDDYFASYINCMLIHGKTDKLYTFLERYNLSNKQAASLVFPRVIFETVNNGYEGSLEFIDNNIDWKTAQNLDAAVSCGEVKVARYIYNNTALSLPSDAAICSAIFDGASEILELLIEKGWKPSLNPIFLSKARGTLKIKNSPAYKQTITKYFGIV